MNFATFPLPAMMKMVMMMAMTGRAWAATEGAR